MKPPIESDEELRALMPEDEIRAEYLRYRKAVDTGEFAYSFIRGHLLLEHYLERLIRIPIVLSSYLLDEGRLTFAQKLVLVEALGLFGREHFESVRQINRIRNRFAHSLDFNPTMADAKAVGECYPEWGKWNLETSDPAMLLGLAVGITICAVAGEVCAYEAAAKRGEITYALIETKRIPGVDLSEELLNNTRAKVAARKKTRERQRTDSKPTATT